MLAAIPTCGLLREASDQWRYIRATGFGITKTPTFRMLTLKSGRKGHPRPPPIDVHEPL